MVQICHEMINQEGFQYPSWRHLTNFIYRKKLFEIVYSPKLICGNCRIARLVDRDLLFTVAARLINSPTTQTLETKPSVKLKKPMPILYARIRPKKEAKIYVQRSKCRMKNAMKQTLWDVNNNQQSTVSPQSPQGDACWNFFKKIFAATIFLPSRNVSKPPGCWSTWASSACKCFGGLSPYLPPCRAAHHFTLPKRLCQCSLKA